MLHPYLVALEHLDLSGAHVGRREEELDRVLALAQRLEVDARPERVL